MAHLSLVSITGVRRAVWFSFEIKSHTNHKIKKHAIWFGWLNFIIQSKLKQIKPMWFVLYRLVRFFRDNNFFLFLTIKSS